MARWSLKASLALSTVAGGMLVGSSQLVAQPEVGEIRLAPLLEEIRQRQAHLRSLTGRFEQIRTSELLVQPERSEGRFWYLRPDRAHWEYLRPKPITLWIDGDRMVTWFHDLGRAEERKIGRASSQALRFLHAPSSVAELEQHFRITLTVPNRPEPYRLDLEPRFVRLERRLRRLVLWIDRELKLPIRMELEDPRGQKTQLRFLELQVDLPLTAEQLAPRVPKEVAFRRVAGNRLQGDLEVQ